MAALVWMSCPILTNNSQYKKIAPKLNGRACKYIFAWENFSLLFKLSHPVKLWCMIKYNPNDKSSPKFWAKNKDNYSDKENDRPTKNEVMGLRSNVRLINKLNTSIIK